MRHTFFTCAAIVSSTALCWIAAVPAGARPVFLSAFTSKYESYSTAISERSCANCHVSTTEFKLNPYGRQVAQALIESGDKKLTPEILEKVEKLDANGDGVSNLDELKAGKAPGDPKAAAAVTPPKNVAEPAPKPDEHKKENGKKFEGGGELRPPASKPPAVGELKSPAGSAKSASQNSVPTRVASAPAKPTAAKIEVAAANVPIVEPAKTDASSSAPTKPEVAKSEAPAAPTADTASHASHEPEAKPLLPANRYHPAIVHFPIALFIGGLLFDLIGTITKRDGLLFAGWYNLVLAAISSVVGVISGFAAMIAMKLPFTGLIPQHMLFAVLGAFIMWMMVSLRVHRHKEMGKPIRLMYYFLAVAGLALISYSGHLGGLYVYGE